MFTVTITSDQLDFLQAYLQNEKINTNEYCRSDTETGLLNAWLTSLEAAVKVS